MTAIDDMMQVVTTIHKYTGTHPEQILVGDEEYIKVTSLLTPDLHALILEKFDNKTWNGERPRVVCLWCGQPCRLVPSSYRDTDPMPVCEYPTNV